MIDWQNFFDQPLKNNLITSESIQKIVTGQGVHYTNGCLLDYNYFKNYYKMIGIKSSKQQALDDDPKAIQQVNFTGNLDRANSCHNFFQDWRIKRNCFRFSTSNCKSILILVFALI